MCGIMGYVGGAEAWGIVLEGLRRLEYRGYDSAGIASVDAGTIQLARAVGPIARLDDAHPAGLPGTLAIGHTRWATHGGVTEANCHPHLDDTAAIAVVHNGIIDNADALREELERDGHTLASETDTEVLAFLVAAALEDGAVSLVEAVRRALRRVVGTAGVLVLSRRHPDRIVAARLGSPVIIGLGDAETWVASDQLALAPFTDRVVVLDDGEVAELTASRVHTIDLDNRDRAKRVERIALADYDIDRGAYDHYLLKEIHEQPGVVDRGVRGRVDAGSGTARLGGLDELGERLFEFDHVTLFAAGTSLHCAQVGQYLLERQARLPATAEDAAELAARNPIVRPRTLYVAVSQSGETADTLQALREIRSRGGSVVGITNVVGSTLARETGRGVYVHAGAEISVCSTKAFTAQTLALTLLALRFARIHHLSAADGRAEVAGLSALPGLVREMLKHDAGVHELARRHRDARYTMFIGRGPNVAVAREGALKLKEIAYIPSDGMSGAQMKHGPLALIEPGSPVWALVPPDDTRAAMLGNIQELKARGASIYAVADGGDAEVARLADAVFALPPHHWALSPLLTVVPLQLYAYYVALELGYDIDKPRSLAKAVTVL